MGYTHAHTRAHTHSRTQQLWARPSATVHAATPACNTQRHCQQQQQHHQLPQQQQQHHHRHPQAIIIIICFIISAFIIVLINVLLCLAINFKLGVHTKNIRSFLPLHLRGGNVHFPLPLPLCVCECVCTACVLVCIDFVVHSGGEKQKTRNLY